MIDPMVRMHKRVRPRQKLDLVLVEFIFVRNISHISSISDLQILKIRV